MSWDELPTESERAHVVEALRELLLAGGPSDFLYRPILVPSEEHFPDPWRADVEGARAMLRRLLARARIDTPFDLTDFREATAAHSTAGWFAGVKDGRLQFGINSSQLNEAELLAGTLVHEVAHAWRHERFLDGEHRDEQLTDLTAIFLGGGVFIANNTFRYRARLTERSSVSESHQLGYVSPGLACFALALMLRARGAGLDLVSGFLERTQRELLERALAQLPSRDEVHSMLGILSVPAAIPLELPSVAPELPAPRQTPSTAKTSRVKRPRPGEFAVLGVLALSGVFFVLEQFGVLLPWPLAVLGAAAGLLGWRFPAVRCADTACACPLRDDDATCPGCGAWLVAPSVE